MTDGTEVELQDGRARRSRKRYDNPERVTTGDLVLLAEQAEVLLSRPLGTSAIQVFYDGHMIYEHHKRADVALFLRGWIAHATEVPA